MKRHPHVFDCFITVELPFKAGRLDAPPVKKHRNKKKYTRKTKHPKKDSE